MLKKAQSLFLPVFHSVIQREYRWCLYVVNLQYSLPDNLLYYITIQYFIFFDFFDFCTIRKQNVGKAYVVGAISGRMRCMSEMSMERSVQLLNHVGWNDPCAEGARAHQ